MEITLDLIKSLRGKTGAGINDCKKALEEAAGDIEKAIELLRKKGAAMAVKRADKIANEGAIKSAISEDLKSGVIIEVNCETDFVSKGDEFQKFAEDIAKTALSTGADDTEKVLSSKASNGLTVKENIDSIMGKVGEKPYDGASFRPGDSFDKSWTIKNTGSATWEAGWEFEYKGGEDMSPTGDFYIGQQVKPGGTITLVIEVDAPKITQKDSGKVFVMTWSLNNGSHFCTPYVAIKVFTP